MATQQIESMEPRRMMAVTAYTADGVLTVNGDAYSNNILVEKSANGSAIVVKSGVGANQKVIQYIASNVVKQINVYAGNGADTVAITPQVTQTAEVHGGRGMDYLSAGGGATKLYGHGNRLNDPTGDHTPATDDSAGDILNGGIGRTVMWGGKGHDTFDTNPAKNVNAYNVDIANGGEGNDTFWLVGNGQASVYGGGGDDLFYMGNQPAKMWGDSGRDAVDYSKIARSTGVAVILDGSAASGPISGATRNQLLQADIELAIGTKFDDTLMGGPGFNMLMGRDGNDFIDAKGGDDVVQGGNGWDTIFGNSGKDVLYGDANHDWIYGGADGDSIYGGEGNDFIQGQGGNDSLKGEGGSDQVSGGAGSDTLNGGDGDDSLYAQGDGFIDYLYGEAGTDSAIVDRIVGNVWDKVVFGVEYIY